VKIENSLSVEILQLQNIPKITKSPYYPKCFTDFDEVWHGNAFLPMHQSGC